ncbi:uncharacterized protein LOC128553278 [Mercenaria mercenaria]|uniref:uncharacterized protein LOC128553278 n=1 Tax=Mercenaria mercenaria TaxID=6596 RepID=UPI00234E6D14|nr:uncharacterized protein LOC128553278 [Mercenaria mercenaria]
MADLFGMQKYAKWNEEYRYILPVIDTFSKYVWLRPLKSKTEVDVADAFKDILSKSGRTPKRLTTDKAISKSYNNSYHRTIGTTPASVNASNEEEVRLATYFAQNPRKDKIDVKLKRFKYKIGDYVRITYLRNVFTRAYNQTYSGEVFSVSKRYYRGILPVYRLNDLQDEEIKGTFYESELQKVDYDPDQAFKIEQILKTRGKGQNKQYFVKWKNYQKKFNSWIKANDFV